MLLGNCAPLLSTTIHCHGPPLSAADCHWSLLITIAGPVHHHLLLFATIHLPSATIDYHRRPYLPPFATDGHYRLPPSIFADRHHSLSMSAATVHHRCCQPPSTAATIPPRSPFSIIGGHHHLPRSTTTHHCRPPPSVVASRHHLPPSARLVSLMT